MQTAPNCWRSPRRNSIRPNRDVYRRPSPNSASTRSLNVRLPHVRFRSREVSSRCLLDFGAEPGARTTPSRCGGRLLFLIEEQCLWQLERGCIDAELVQLHDSTPELP